MPRLPQPGSDDGTWGDVLNTYLSVSHDSDGSLKTASVDERHLTVDVRTKLNQNGSVTGPQGPKGDTGANGASGADSTVPGPQGPQGEAGVAGTTSWVGITDKPASFTPTAHTHNVTDIFDASLVGRSVMTATDAVVARNVIGAGTSSLTIGTTPGTAKAGDYVPTKLTVGLGAVDNTSDVQKPVSIATQAALDLKADQAATSTALAAKADASAVGAKILLIDTAASLPAGTPAGVIVVVKG